MDADHVVLGMLTPPGAGKDGVPLQTLWGTGAGLSVLSPAFFFRVACPLLPSLPSLPFKSQDS